MRLLFLKIIWGFWRKPKIQSSSFGFRYRMSPMVFNKQKSLRVDLRSTLMKELNQCGVTEIFLHQSNLGFSINRKGMSLDYFTQL